MKVLNRKEIEELLFSDWGYSLCYDTFNQKVYIYDNDYKKVGYVRFDTFLKINMKKFHSIKKSCDNEYYGYCNILPKDTIYKY